MKVMEKQRWWRKWKEEEKRGKDKMRAWGKRGKICRGRGWEEESNKKEDWDDVIRIKREGK